MDNTAPNMTDKDLGDSRFTADALGHLAGTHNFVLGKNFSLEDFVRIVQDSQQQLHWFGPEIEVPLIVIYTIIIIVGFLSNGCICYLILMRKSLRTVRNMFIMNLALSDMIMCIFCMPFTLVKLLLKNWSLGDVMCRMVPWLQAVNVFCSTITITAIALDRYQVIIAPSTAKDNTKRWSALMVILLIWFFSVLVGLPLLVYSHVDTKQYIQFIKYTMCLEEWPSALSRIIYGSCIMTLQFIIPIALIIITHWRICNFLKCRILMNPKTPSEMERAMKEAQTHRKNSTLLMAIALIFALCWFPLTLLNLLADLNYFIFMYKNFLLAFAIAHIFAMISACLNPIIYGWFNSTFRREFRNLVFFWKHPLHDLEQKGLMAHEPSPELHGLLMAAGGQNINYYKQVSARGHRVKAVSSWLLNYIIT